MRAAHWLALAVVAVAAVSVRVVCLDSLPGEWYGDISTVYEYVLALRHGDHAPGYFVLGIGPVYPELTRPFLAVLGDEYLAFKTAGVTFGLAGLVLLYRLGVMLFDHTTALVAVAIGSIWSWSILFHRLGDQHPLNPLLAVAVSICSLRATRSRAPEVWAIAGAFLASLGLYVYANSFVLPLLGGGVVLFAVLRRGMPVRVAVAYATASLLTAASLLGEQLGDLERVRHGHFGQRVRTGWAFFPDVLAAFGRSIAAYVDGGDPGFRSNVANASHIDRLSLLAVCAGVIAVVAHRRRATTGVFVLGAVVLLHLPAALAGSDEVPNAGRTFGAYPFLALLAGRGLVSIGQVIRRWSPPAALATLSVAIVVIGAVNVRHYFVDYARGLPDENTPVARLITEFADGLPGDVEVHLMAPGWAQAGMPEEKSVRYDMDRPEMLVVHVREEFDCTTVAAIRAPAVVIWSDRDELPNEQLRSCTGLLSTPRTHVTGSGRPVFHSAMRTACLTRRETAAPVPGIHAASVCGE